MFDFLKRLFKKDKEENLNQKKEISKEEKVEEKEVNLKNEEKAEIKPEEEKDDEPQELEIKKVVVNGKEVPNPEEGFKLDPNEEQIDIKIEV